MAETLKYPNFLIIGAGKSGTTSLYNYVKQHPEVFMSRIKEPNFMALEGQSPVDPKDDPEQLYHYPQAVYTLDDYKKLFAGVADEKAVGESSTMYLYKPGADKRIKKYIPNAKMIAIFRDPASRLYSRWMHLARDNQLPSDSLEDCFDRGSIWWRRDDLVREGFYYTHLSKYFEQFDREQFKIYLHEDLRTDTENMIRGLYEFLEIDPGFKPVTDVEYNVSGIVKNKFKDKLIGGDSIIRKGIQKISPGLVRKMRSNIKMQRVVTGLRKKNLEKPKLDPGLRKRLIEDLYKDEILKFQDLIGRDLSAWLK